jgi:hypothetical protein
MSFGGMQDGVQRGSCQEGIGQSASGGSPAQALVALNIASGMGGDGHRPAPGALDPPLVHGPRVPMLAAPSVRNASAVIPASVWSVSPTLM